jgi:small subunit ribosomal protein S3
VEDQKIRNFIKNHPTRSLSTADAGIDRIEIERTRDEVKVFLFVAKPGLIIGKKGQEVEVLQEELQNLIGRRVNLKIEEIISPGDSGAAGGRGHRPAVGEAASFRRTMKRSMEQTMDAGAKGIKIQLAGRWAGPKWRGEKADRRSDCR